VARACALAGHINNLFIDHQIEAEHAHARGLATNISC